MAYRDYVVGAAFVTVAPSRWSATWNASARVAFVMMSLRLTPRWTIVWAICGRMPLKCAVCPHETRRRDGLHEMLCDQCVDRRHSRDVDDRKLGAGVDDTLQQSLHDDLVLALSSVPIKGSASTSSPSWTTGVDNSMSSCCCGG